MQRQDKKKYQCAHFRHILFYKETELVYKKKAQTCEIIVIVEHFIKSNLGRHTWVSLQQLQEQRYLVLLC